MPATKDAIDTTRQWDQAERAADEVDFVKQYGLLDIDGLMRKVRAAYIHGYVQGLRASVGKGASDG